MWSTQFMQIIGKINFLEKETVLLLQNRELVAIEMNKCHAQLKIFHSKEADLLLQQQQFITEEMNRLYAKLKIFHTELELVNAELSIVQRYRSVTDKEGLPNFPNSSENWKAEVRKSSASQLGQDIWVLEQTNYKRNGFFVEFGATNGISLSNSWLLEKMFGWSGICAEPNPLFFQQLEENRKCIVSSNCIGKETGDKVEFVLADAYGGMTKHANSDFHFDKRNAYAVTENNVVTFETVSLHDFLLKYNAPKYIDYLSIDTEGSEFEILEHFPFEEWDIQYITVEHNFTDQRNKIFSLLKENGYARIEAQWDDWYYKTHGHISNELDRLNKVEPTKLFMIHCFIFNWPKTTENVKKLYKQLSLLINIKFKLTVLNCDNSYTEKSWINLPTDYYFGQQFATALEYFSGDILFHIQGDAYFDDWESLVIRARGVFEKYNCGVYAPNVDYTAWSSESLKLQEIEFGLWSVKHTDCTCWFINRQLFFHLPPDKVKENKFGWGIDLSLYAIAWHHKKLVLRDYNFKILHPCSTGYSKSEANTQMLAYLSTFDAAYLSELLKFNEISIALANINNFIKEDQSCHIENDKPTLALVVISNKAHNLKTLIQWARQSGLFNQIIAIADADANDPELNKVAQLADICEILPVKGYIETVLNHACSLAQTDWILRLDCDERLGNWAKQELPKCLNGKYDYYWMPRYWLYQDAQHHISNIYEYQLRLFRRGYVTHPDHVHFSPIGKGEQGQANFHIFHFDLLWTTEEERREKMQRYQSVATKLDVSDQFILYTPINPALEKCQEPLDWEFSTINF